jgi:hypothetical protein
MSLSGSQPGIFDSHRSRAIVGCVVTFTVTSTVTLVLRIIAKRMKKTKLCAEDWFIMAAQVRDKTTTLACSLHFRFLTFFAQIAIYGMAACSILGMELLFHD